jgi:hypothetical protein
VPLGNPIFTEHDKATPPKPVVINGTHGLQVSYLGSGVVKGVILQLMEVSLLYLEVMASQI